MLLKTAYKMVLIACVLNVITAVVLTGVVFTQIAAPIDLPCFDKSNSEAIRAETTEYDRSDANPPISKEVERVQIYQGTTIGGVLIIALSIVCIVISLTALVMLVYARRDIQRQ